MTAGVLTALDSFVPRDDAEARDVAAIRALAAETNPWPRSLPLHVTGSALIVHPSSRRVLLRWHQRQQAWLQVGGHGDPGETNPYDVALREAREETSLPDLQPWPAPTPSVIQVAIVPVAAGKGEPPHQHADVRYALATSHPDAVRPESDKAELRWLAVGEALELAGDENLRVTLRRVEALFAD